MMLMYVFYQLRLFYNHRIILHSPQQIGIMVLMCNIFLRKVENPKRKLEVDAYFFEICQIFLLVHVNCTK
jgi:hypothetical protein